MAERSGDRPKKFGSPLVVFYMHKGELREKRMEIYARHNLNTLEQIQFRDR